jgi:DNA polymerase III subunit chi
MQRVDFYVLEGSDARERLKFACRVIDKAFQAEQRVLVCFDSNTELASFDDLLWTFAQDSFVPHEPLTAESDWEETPVLLTSKQPPAKSADVIVNLGAALPPDLSNTPSIIEIIDADAVRRQAGRVRYKQYRDQGVEPQTHKVGETN